MNTHARLDELLHERNMTLYQLCQSGNIPYTTLRVSRCRGSQLSVDTIEQICKVLGISMAEFFTVHAEAKSMNDRLASNSLLHFGSLRFIEMQLGLTGGITVIKINTGE